MVATELECRVSWRRVLRVGSCILALSVAPFALAQDDAAALRERANSLIGRGDYEDARRVLDAAFDAVADDEIEHVRLELVLSSLHRRRGELDRAESVAERALARARRTSDVESIVRALRSVSRLARDRGRVEVETAALQEAAALLEQVTSHELRGRVLAALGLNAFSRGESEEGFERYEQALASAERAGVPDLTVTILTARSSSLLGQSRYDESLADAQRAYDLRDGLDVATQRAAVTFTLAQVNAHLWNLDVAAQLWTEAVDLYQEGDFPTGVAITRKQRMETWFALEELERAAEDGAAAIEHFRALGSERAYPEVFARMALIESRRADWDAVERYERLAVHWLERTAVDRRIYIASDLALVALYAGRLDESEERFRRALELARDLRDPEYEWRALDGVGRAFLARGEPQEAESFFEEAVTLVERLRRGLPDAGQRATLVSGRTGPYERWVRSLMQQSEAPGDEHAIRALEVSERSRGRAMADLLAESRAQLTDPRIASIKNEEVAFSRRLTELQKQIMGESEPAKRNELLRSLAEAERELDALVVRARRASPAYAALAHPEPIDTTSILELLSPREALVEFSLDDDVGFAWVVRPGVGVASFRVPGRAELGPRVRLLHGSVASGDEAGVARLGEELFEALLAPGWDAMDGVERVIVVPDGPLRRLPFALLRVPGGEWLIEQVSLHTAPSATLLRELRAHPPGRGSVPLLAAAYDGADAATRAAQVLHAESGPPLARLEHVAAEARNAVRILGGEEHSPASERAIKDARLLGFRVLHFASHTIVDEVVPRRSALVLGGDETEDGLLQLNEVANLGLSADLVVLATCRSHIGRSLRGEGLLSLSRAFMFAGARAVLATLWSVEDAETTRFMTAFYSGLADGLSAAAALREAQLESIERGAPASSWAGFVIAGDGSHAIFEGSETSGRRPLLVAGFAAVTLLSLLWLRRRTLSATARSETS